eukprot:5932416-Pyramimonas_sp.AAC.1
MGASLPSLLGCGARAARQLGQEARGRPWQACAFALAKRRKRRDLVSMPRGIIRRCALGRARRSQSR